MKTSAATTERGDLIYDRDAVASARAVAVLVPGAFCRVSMFDAAEDWRSHGYALVRYRFPGLDGRPVRPPLDIAGAAAEIARFAAALPPGKLRLLGYSTGAAVALEVASRLACVPPVALMSPAVELGGGAETAGRTARHLAAAALRARSLRLEPLWLEYYRVLLFGTEVLGDSTLAARAEAIIAARRDRIVLPVAALRDAHTGDLRRWRLPAGLRPDSRRIHIFRGAADVVFSAAQTARFAGALGPAGVTSHAGHGHLLFASRPETFGDVLAFFEGGAPG